MMNGGIDVEFVCQLCAGKPSLASVDTLAGHLRHQHGIRVSDAAAVDTFIRDHVTFEETLEATSDREDAKTEIEAAEPNALPAFSCPFCKSVFSSTARLICHLGRHLKINIEEGVVCCDASYTGRNAFVAHLQEAHVAKPAAGRGHTCRSCGFEAVDGERLQAHIAESHGKRRRSPSKESPRNQKYIPAVCPECNKTFSNKYNMFVHMKSHGEQRRFPCDKCHRSYRNGSNLRNHKRLVHEGVMEYACGVCGEPFPSRGARDVHARGHAGLAPFACARCGKAFRAKNSLDRHAEGHLDLREHECHVCAKKFRKISHLKYHVGTHERA